MDIQQKFKDFVPHTVYYDEINRKIAQIQNAIREVKRIKTHLTLNMGKDVKCSGLLMIAEEQEDYLETMLEGVKQRQEQLKLVWEDCLDDSDEDFFHRNFCSPDDHDDEDLSS